MRKSRFSESQIVTVLKEAEAGVPINELIRKHGISRNTYFNWKARYSGADDLGAQAAEGARGREREAEEDVQRIGAGKRGDQGPAAAKTVTPFAKRAAATILASEFGLTVARACRIVRFSRAAYYRAPQQSSERDAAVIAALGQQVDRHPGSGFRKCFGRLRGKGHGWNHKRVHRVYCALKLNLPRKTKRRVPGRLRQSLEAPKQLNHIWAVDFMADALYGGRKIRTLNVFDSVEDVQIVTDEWLEDYNSERPHDSLGRVPPRTFLPRPERPLESSYQLST